jgi:hypothetical protein
MKFDAIKGLIGTLAPTIGKALGGPLGGAAAQTIASVLGCKTDEKSITTAIQAATPEQLAEIKRAELGFKTRMKELDVDVFNLKQTISRMREWLSKVTGRQNLLRLLASYFSEVTSRWSRYKTLLLQTMALLILCLVIWVGSSAVSYLFTTALPTSTTNEN